MTTERLRVWRDLVRLSLRADRRSVLLIVAFAPVSAVGIALVSVGQRHLVDSAGHSAVGALLAAALLGATGHLITNGLSRSSANLQYNLAERVDVLVNDEVLREINRLPTLSHLERPDYLDRLTMLAGGTPALARAVWSLLGSATALVQIALSMWLLYQVHPAVSLLVLFALPPLWTAGRAQTPIRRAHTGTAGHKRQELRLHQMFLDPKPAGELHLTRAAGTVDATAAALWRAGQRELLRARLAGTAWQLSGWALYTAGYITALALGVWLTGRGEATLGDLVLLLTLGTHLRAQVAAAARELTATGEAGQYIEHRAWLNRYAATQPRPGTLPAPARLRTGIALHGVEFRYPGTTEPVLSGIDLTLRAGTTVAVVGVNGAGKTTLVKLLAGLYRPTAGTITVDGHDLDTLDVTHWRRRTTAVFQDFLELHVSAREAVAVGEPSRMDDRDAVLTAITSAGAHGVIDSLPDGLDTRLGLPGGTELSRGQWQKLALARGAMRPTAALRMLDEPTAALDPLAEHQVYRRFAEQARQSDAAVTLLVSHRFATVRTADHIIVLDQGRITEQGTHQALMDRGGTYAHLYRVQSSGYA